MVGTPEQAWNHNPESVTPSYPNPVIRARTISRNKTGGLRSQHRKVNYYYLCYHFARINAPLDKRWNSDPWRGVGYTMDVLQR
jgi:hypothetical protein